MQLKNDTQGLVDLFKPQITMGEGNNVTIPTELFADNMEAGKVTADEVKRVDAYRTNVVAAVAHCVSEVAVDHMAANGKVDIVTFSMPLGKDVYDGAILRSKVYAKSGDTPKLGVLQARYVSGAGVNRGELKVAKGLLHQRATEALAAK